MTAPKKPIRKAVADEKPDLANELAQLKQAFEMLVAMQHEDRKRLDEHAKRLEVQDAFNKRVENKIF